MKRIALISTLALTLALPALAGAGKNDDNRMPWIHVEVLEDGGNDASVKVNLPLSMAAIALGMIEEDSDLISGHMNLEGCELTVSDMRRMWRELRNAGDAEFVTIEEGDESIRVYRRGDRVFVDIEENDGDERVKVEVPVALVDALLGGTGEQLDFEAALAELENLERGDIVRIQDGRDRVRVWID